MEMGRFYKISLTSTFPHPAHKHSCPGLILYFNSIAL